MFVFPGAELCRISQHPAESPSAVPPYADHQAAASEWPQGHVHHYFCRQCGVRGFSKGYLEMAPFNGWFHAVNIATLDGLSDEEMAAIPVQYENGRHGEWEHPPAATAHM